LGHSSIGCRFRKSLHVLRPPPPSFSRLPHPLPCLAYDLAATSR
jgi:hypothetical protein